MIRVSLVLMIIGLINALIAIGLTDYFQARSSIDPDALLEWGKVVFWIWPAGIGMMAGDSGRAASTTMIMLVMCVIGNTLIYGVVGIALGAVWQKLRERSRSR
jgi:hypothetical protein